MYLKLIQMKEKISILTFLIIIGCSRHQDRTLDLTLDNSAFIKLTVLNCQDTTEFLYKTTPMLPRGCVSIKVEITHDSIYYFSHKTTKPDFIDLTLRKRFQTYVIPGDTLEIVANLDPNVSDDDAIITDGEFGEIMNFFSKKHERLGYLHINYALANIISYPIEKVFSLSDSICNNELEFLNSYYNKNNLPYWFYETMKADIEYNKVWIRPNQVMYRYYFFKEKLNNPETYFIFDQVSLYNPKAKYSDIYYQCIDTYLWFNHQWDIEDKSGVDRALPLFERSIPEAKKILKGEIFEYYLGYKTSELFAICENIDELTRIDSLFSSLKTQFENEEIIDIINNQRDYKAGYFESLKNNPFNFTKIIPADN